MPNTDCNSIWVLIKLLLSSRCLTCVWRRGSCWHGALSLRCVENPLHSPCRSLTDAGLRSKHLCAWVIGTVLLLYVQTHYTINNYYSKILPDRTDHSTCRCLCKTNISYFIEWHYALTIFRADQMNAELLSLRCSCHLDSLWPAPRPQEQCVPGKTNYASLTYFTFV